MLLQEPVKEYKLPVLERSPLKMPSTKSNYSVFQSPVPHLICCKQNTAVLYYKDLLHHHKPVKMLAYLISRNMYLLKGVLCILELD
jgi:DNA polymerase-3 subunit alpha/error-prone DNA polymerase